MKTFVLPLGAVLAASALLLAGCSAPTPDDGVIRVVASTDVYGNLAEAVGGSGIDVTSIITDPSQDPHSFEADARIQLALSKADIVIGNGGGYDDFVNTLLAGADNPGAVVLTAVDLFAGEADSSAPGFNEHVWYDLPTMAAVATDLADALARLDPAEGPLYRSNAAAFAATLVGLEGRIADLRSEVAGTGVAITEPVPLYLLEAAGLANRTPTEFSDAIEEGSGIPPAVLKAALDLFESGAVGAFVYNEQTGGPETDRLLAAAEDAGVPVVPVTETLPAGKDYLTWMSDNIAALEDALT